MARIVAQSITLTSLQREVLGKIFRRSKSSQQHVTRAKIVLLAADGFTNQSIADQLNIHREKVRCWRGRWFAASEKLLTVEMQDNEQQLHQQILETLSDMHRSGVMPTYTAEVVCQIIAVAFEKPEASGHPISHWTPAALRLEVIKRNIVEDISIRQIGRFLKRKGNKTASAALLGDATG